MDERIIEFVRGLRAAGVRVSVSESIDALRAVHVLGIQDKERFRGSMRATLVKDADDIQLFEELFPLFFGSGGPSLQNALEELAKVRARKSWKNWHGRQGSIGLIMPRRGVG
jgi:uncharacterized protein with von Willebrand factor type A (vWA) domain